MPPNVNSSASKEMDLIVFPSCDGCGLNSWDCSKQAGMSAYWSGKGRSGKFRHMVRIW